MDVPQELKVEIEIELYFALPHQITLGISESLSLVGPSLYSSPSGCIFSTSHLRLVMVA